MDAKWLIYGFMCRYLSYSLFLLRLIVFAVRQLVEVDIVYVFVTNLQVADIQWQPRIVQLRLK